jgi:hypothetical protein
MTPLKNDICHLKNLGKRHKIKNGSTFQNLPNLWRLKVDAVAGTEEGNWPHQKPSAPLKLLLPSPDPFSKDKR